MELKFIAKEKWDQANFIANSVVLFDRSFSIETLTGGFKCDRLKFEAQFLRIDLGNGGKQGRLNLRVIEGMEDPDRGFLVGIKIKYSCVGQHRDLKGSLTFNASFDGLEKRLKNLEACDVREGLSTFGNIFSHNRKRLSFVVTFDLKLKQVLPKMLALP